jgi:hypothetical protein
VVADVLAARPGVSEVNWPPTRILPSDCSAIALTLELGDGSKVVSSVPSALSRSRFSRCVAEVVRAGVTELNVPPTRILPSGWSSTTPTWPSMLGLNSESIVPLGLRRAMWFRVSPPIVVKAPPTMTLPSAWRAVV